MKVVLHEADELVAALRVHGKHLEDPEELKLPAEQLHLVDVDAEHLPRVLRLGAQADELAGRLLDEQAGRPKFCHVLLELGECAPHWFGFLNLGTVRVARTAAAAAQHRT